MMLAYPGYVPQSSSPHPRPTAGSYTPPAAPLACVRLAFLVAPPRRLAIMTSLHESSPHIDLDDADEVSYSMGICDVTYSGERLG